MTWQLTWQWYAKQIMVFLSFRYFMPVFCDVIVLGYLLKIVKRSRFIIAAFILNLLIFVLWHFQPLSMPLLPPQTLIFYITPETIKYLLMAVVIKVFGYQLILKKNMLKNIFLAVLISSALYMFIEWGIVFLYRYSYTA